MAEERVPVVFVPGICGSTLKYRDRFVWGDLLTLTVRDYSRLTLLSPWHGPTSVLEPASVLEEVKIYSRHVTSVYKDFFTFLRETLKYEDEVDLFPFAYDWRLDCRYSAFKLKIYLQEMRRKLRDQHAKFVIIAHSMGGTHRSILRTES